VIDPFENIKDDIDNKININTFPPLATTEEEIVIKNFYNQYPQLKQKEALGDAWVQTYSGKKLYPFYPNLDAIVLEDIAKSLSNQCRFTGHVCHFYSIAQHCVLVSYICDKKDALHGLLHDGSEFALTDLPSPLKRMPEFAGYKIVEKILQNAIYRKFGLTEIEPPGVKEADLRLLATEARDLRPIQHSDWKLSHPPLPFKIEPLPPKEAEQLFLERFRELTNG